MTSSDVVGRSPRAVVYRKNRLTYTQVLIFCRMCVSSEVFAVCFITDTMINARSKDSAGSVVIFTRHVHLTRRSRRSRFPDCSCGGCLLPGVFSTSSEREQKVLTARLAALRIDDEKEVRLRTPSKTQSHYL